MKPLHSKLHLYLLAFAMVISTQTFGQEALDTRGLVRSSARVEVRTDLVAAVAKAPFKDGARFKKGAKLITFDCSRYRAELNSARAGASAAAIELRNKRRLFKNGAAGKSEVQLARAEAARNNAEVKARLSRVSQCVIKAPFAGRVVVLNTRKYEMPNASKPVIIILDDSALELELVVPSNWLVWLEPGREFLFKVDETGKTHPAKIVSIGAEVDPVSQTIKAYGVLLETNGRVLAGMSGQARFSPKGS
ncbi:MAG: HlyD family efflux transporter periplasmic adaptor subunit [Rhizobiaceae bacterium]